MKAWGADVVVVGAGVVGACAAYHLARSGARVVVLDRRGVAAGATGTSAGFVRVYHHEPTLTRLAHESWPEFAGWGDLVGGSIDFVRTGCVHELPPSSDPSRTAGLSEDTVTTWNIVRGRDLRHLFPSMQWPADTLALFEPHAGYAAPWRCAEQYLRRVIEFGGSVWTGVVALRLLVERGRAAGVMTSAGLLPATAVVVATGAWSGTSSLVELDVSLRTKRIVTQRVFLPRATSGIPAYINEGAGSFFFRPDGPSHILVGGGEGEWGEYPANRPNEPSETSLREARCNLERRVGVPVTCAEVVSGLDAYTPDGLPIVDRYAPVEGAYVATGFSGSGFKIAPAVGRMLADWITTGTKDDLLVPLCLQRFTTATPCISARKEDEVSHGGRH